MTNSLTRMPDPASQWFWNGSQWVCGCDPDDSQPPVVIQPPFPPPFFPPPITQPPWYPGANGGVSFGVTAPPNPIRGAFWWDGLVLWIFDGAAWVNTATGVTEGGGSGGGGSSGSGAGTVVISTQPPGNPVTGMQWWDGTVLRVWDGTKWNIVGPGASAGPVPTTTHTFRMTQTTAINGLPAAWTVVPFTGSPQIDPQLSYNSQTFKVTPTRAGVYMFTFKTWMGTANDGALIARNDDGGGIGNQTEILAIDYSSAAGWCQGMGVALMNGTTDFVRLYALMAGGGPFGGYSWPVLDYWLLP